MPEREDYRRYLEDKLNTLNERVKILEVLTQEFTKISTILEIQIELNKKHDSVLERINENLINLNNTTKTLGTRVEQIESSVEKVRERDNISFVDAGKKVIWTIFTLVAGGFVTWMFLILRKEK